MVWIIIGIIIDLVGLIHQNGKIRFSISIKAICITILTTFILGIVGLIIGKFYLTNIEINWWKPKNLIDTENFIAVGSMHNFGYLGGLISMILAIIYSVKVKRKMKI